MLILILGLALFLGMHSARIVAEPARRRFIERRGENAWKGLYTIVSLLGFVLIIVGYRAAPYVSIWAPPLWLRHATLLLTAVAFVLLVAAYIPNNRVKAAVGHPMVLGVKVWAFAHLLANGALASMILFGAFLAWAVADFVAARRRDRLASAGGTTLVSGEDSVGDDARTTVATGGLGPTIATIAIGLAAWVAFAGWLHLLLIGVSPIAVGASA